MKITYFSKLLWCISNATILGNIGVCAPPSSLIHNIDQMGFDQVNYVSSLPQTIRAALGNSLARCVVEQALLYGVQSLGNPDIFGVWGVIVLIGVDLAYAKWMPNHSMLAEFSRTVRTTPILSMSKCALQLGLKSLAYYNLRNYAHIPRPDLVVESAALDPLSGPASFPVCTVYENFSKASMPLLTMPVAKMPIVVSNFNIIYPIFHMMPEQFNEAICKTCEGSGACSAPDELGTVTCTEPLGQTRKTHNVSSSALPSVLEPMYDSVSLPRTFAYSVCGLCDDTDVSVPRLENYSVFSGACVKNVWSYDIGISTCVSVTDLMPVKNGQDEICEVETLKLRILRGVSPLIAYVKRASCRMASELGMWFQASKHRVLAWSWES